MPDQGNIEKLLSMQIEQKMRTKVASEDVVSFDEFIALTSKSGGMPEWKLKEAFRAWTETIMELSVEQRKEFLEKLRLSTGIEFKIVEEDS